MTASTDRDLLFGLISLQLGLVDQAQLVTAFQAWARDKTRSLADHLGDRGGPDTSGRVAVEAIVALHIKAHGGDAEKSLAAIGAGPSTRESLGQIGDPEIIATMAHMESGSGGDSDLTKSFSVGTSTSDGQRFRILRPHAKGGLGIVLVALDGELHREVALKQLQDRHADDPISRGRFLVEAEITGGLEHPGIVPVYGLGSYADGRPYYAMRFIRGDSLKEAIAAFHADERRNSEPGVIALELRKLLLRFLDICNAIEYAHRRGVLHRDLKPSNVMVGMYGETLVVDWGLAKAVGRVETEPTSTERMLIPSSASGTAETLPGSVQGTPAYMSPEQAAGDQERLGTASDVYSLGATLYCLLTGRPPFEGDDVGAVLRNVQKGAFPPPRKLDRTIDPALEAVCLKAMALKTEDRYVSPRALAEDIERWMADEPITARREPTVERARRWMRRRRTVVTAAMAAIIVGVAGLVLLLLVQSKANRDLRASNAREVLARDQAQSRFDLAMSAIQIFHSGVSEDVLLKEEQFDDLRGKLLRGARDFYGRLGTMLKDQTDRSSLRALGLAEFEVAELTSKVSSMPEALAAHREALAVREALSRQPEADPSSKVDVARSLFAIASVQDALSNSAEALTTLERARLLLDPLVRSQPPIAADLSVLARVENGIAVIQAKMGQSALALESHRRALAIRQDIAHANPSVASSLNELAKSHNSIGVLLMAMGRRPEGTAAFSQAIQIREKLAVEHPTVNEFQTNLAWSYHNDGCRMAEIGDLPTAVSALERALAIRQKLTKANPAVTSYQLDLATSYSDIALRLMEIGKRQEAIESFGQSLAIRQKLADANPSVTAFQNHLAWSYSNGGVLRAQAGDSTQALELEKRALEIRRRLASASPDVVEFQKNLALSNNHIGILLAASGDRTGALASFEQALAIRRKLAEDNPALTELHTDLAWSYHNSAVMLTRAGDQAGALRLHEQALAIRQKLAAAHPLVITFQIDLAASLCQVGNLRQAAGQLGGARASFEQLIAILDPLPTLSPTDLYGLACAHSLLSGLAGKTGSGITVAKGRVEAEQAMRSFRRAIAAGYRDIANIRNDSDLDPIRSRPDFRLLMMDLAFPAEPIAPRQSIP